MFSCKYYSRLFRLTLAFILVFYLLIAALPVASSWADESNGSIFAGDRVIVKLADTQGLRMMLEPDLGIDYTDIRLLNPAAAGVKAEAFSLMSTAAAGNNVFVVTLEETGIEAVEQALETLNANPAVEIAEPDYYYEINAVPNDPWYPSQYSLTSINAPQAWNIFTGDKAVAVGIIDSGIEGLHPDLTDNLWVNPNPGKNGYVNDIHGYSFTKRTGGIPTDNHGHGTYIAGIIGATGNNGVGVCGVNWDVSLVWLGVYDDSSRLSLSGIIEALNYAGNNGITITNNSYGNEVYSQLFKEAIQNYSGLFVTAAGNSGTNNDERPIYPANYDCPNIIAVASTTSSDTLAPTSNYGAKNVDIAAPGVQIHSTNRNGGYSTSGGTSMACPLVVGVAALIKGLNPECTTDRIKSYICETARHAPELADYGFGILDANGALSYCLERMYITGDVNRDELINMVDVLIIYQCFRGKATLTDDQLVVADVDKSGQVDMRDVLLVYQYFRGKVTEFPAGP